ncbi:hypothetical protein GCM10008932_21690 [Alkalibacterium iburiense]|uniref:General stress protein 17M-like domain-containing protein n=1 Tax=Alkalibacterium iburiense TaxID=290589 RepID=A0ABN0XPQ6_9LACT
MENRDKTVVGSYASQEEAMEKVKSLQLEGYRKEDIIVYSKHFMEDEVGSDATAIQAEDSDYKDDDKEDHRSAWDKIKDAFTPDSYDYNSDDNQPDHMESEDILYPYREDIQKGHVVIVTQNFSGEQENDDNFDSSGAMVSRNRVENPEMGSATDHDPLTDGREFDRASEQDNQKRQ